MFMDRKEDFSMKCVFSVCRKRRRKKACTSIAVCNLSIYSNFLVYALCARPLFIRLFQFFLYLHNLNYNHQLAQLMNTLLWFFFLFFTFVVADSHHTVCALFMFVLRCDRFVFDVHDFQRLASHFCRVCVCHRTYSHRICMPPTKRFIYSTFVCLK